MAGEKLSSGRAEFDVLGICKEAMLHINLKLQKEEEAGDTNLGVINM